MHNKYAQHAFIHVKIVTQKLIVYHVQIHKIDLILIVTAFVNKDFMMIIQIVKNVITLVKNVLKIHKIVLNALIMVIIEKIYHLVNVYKIQ